MLSAAGDAVLAGCFLALSAAQQMCSPQPFEPVLLQCHPLCSYSSSSTEVLAHSPALQTSRKVHFLSSAAQVLLHGLAGNQVLPSSQDCGFGTLCISLITGSYFSVH